MRIHNNSFSINWYAFFILLSFLVGYLYIGIGLWKEKVEKHLIAMSAMLTVSCCVYCALLFTMISNVIHGIDIRNIGLSGTGGAVGHLIGALIMSKILKQQGAFLWERYSNALPLLYGISKMACLFAGCCYGIRYDGFFCLRYDSLDDPVFPVQAVEVITFLALFAWTVRRGGKNQAARTLIACCLLKALLDFLRDTHMTQVISTNQIACVMIAVVVAVVDRRRRRGSVKIIGTKKTP